MSLKNARGPHGLSCLSRTVVVIVSVLIVGVYVGISDVVLLALLQLVVN